MDLVSWHLQRHGQSLQETAMRSAGKPPPPLHHTTSPTINEIWTAGSKLGMPPAYPRRNLCRLWSWYTRRDAALAERLPPHCLALHLPQYQHESLDHAACRNGKLTTPNVCAVWRLDVAFASRLRCPNHAPSQALRSRQPIPNYDWQ